MQVTLLKLNAGIGRAVEHSGAARAAQRRAAGRDLRAESDDRISSWPSRAGMVLPTSDNVATWAPAGASAARTAAGHPAQGEARRRCCRTLAAADGRRPTTATTDPAAPTTTTASRRPRPACPTRRRPSSRPTRPRPPAAATTAAPTPAAPTTPTTTDTTAGTAATPRPRPTPPSRGHRGGATPGAEPRGLTDRRIGLLFALFLGSLAARDAALRMAGRRQRARRSSSAAATQQVQKVTLPARAATISDRDGVVLAVSEPADDVSATPYLVKDRRRGRRADSRRCSASTQASCSAKLSEHTGFVYLGTPLPADRAARVAALKSPGIDAHSTSSRRTYPRDWLASQVLGARSGPTAAAGRASSTRTTARCAATTASAASIQRRARPADRRAGRSSAPRPAAT